MKNNYRHLNDQDRIFLRIVSPISAKDSKSIWRRFKGRRIVSNAISMQASRLISNCVIAYNAMLLNELYLKLCTTIGEEQAKAILRKISPVAWLHIIFTGRYHFKDYDSKMNFEKLIVLLEKKTAKNRMISIKN